MTTDNVYDKAREVLRERGRMQGLGRSGNGRTCLVGAVNIACGEVWQGCDLEHLYSRSEVLALAPVILEQFGDRMVGWSRPDVIAWVFNDLGATTDADVDLVLDKAARQWDETHGGAL